MSSVTANLIALMLEDEPDLISSLVELLSLADISVTGVRDSDAALRHFDQINIGKTPLDIFITDGNHPGMRGPRLIRKIRDFPDEMTMQGGLRLRHIPIVTFSASIDHSEIAAIDPSIACVDKPSDAEVLLKAIDTSVRDYRDRILADLHHVGMGVQFTGGRFTLVQCYSLPAGKRFESKYIDGSALRSGASASNAYRRLLLVSDRHWNAQLAIQELESLLNCDSTTERDLQHFFRLHPEFLYQNCVVDHWAEPQLHDKRSGQVFRPDFVLKSLFLPDRPWSWQVVDLKRPGVPLLTSTKFHAALSQHVHRVVAQLRDYSEYFDDPANQAEVEATFGSGIMKPKLVAVIGRLPKSGVLRDYARLKSQLLDVSIMTYDEVLEFRRSQIQWRSSLRLVT